MASSHLFHCNQDNHFFTKNNIYEFIKFFWWLLLCCAFVPGITDNSIVVQLRWDWMTLELKCNLTLLEGFLVSFGSIFGPFLSIWWHFGDFLNKLWWYLMNQMPKLAFWNIETHLETNFRDFWLNLRQFMANLWLFSRFRCRIWQLEYLEANFWDFWGIFE